MTQVNEGECSQGNPFGYADEVWRLFNTAPRAGGFPEGEPGVVTGAAGTPAAKSVLELQFKLAENRIVDARFRAYGCPTSIAVGVWIAGWSLGRQTVELSQLRAADLRRVLEIPDEKAHCALMGEDALRAAVARFS